MNKLKKKNEKNENNALGSSTHSDVIMKSRKKVRFAPQLISEHSSEFREKDDNPALTRISSQNVISQIKTHNGVQYMSLEDAKILRAAGDSHVALDAEDDQEHTSGMTLNPVESVALLEQSLVNLKHSSYATDSQVPWIDHLSVTVNRYVLEDEPFGLDEDQKREATFHQIADMGVREALRRLKILKLSFTRPSDFYAELLKTDQHMEKVKNNLTLQQKKIQCIEERKKNQQRKKFAKKIRGEKLQKKQKEKIENLKKIEKWKASKFKTPL